MSYQPPDPYSLAGGDPAPRRPMPYAGRPRPVGDPLRGAIHPQTGVVQKDLVCRKCGYNLRGLHIDTRCPECGTPVGFSTQGDLFRFCDPEWVHLLRKGVMLILVGVAVMMLGLGLSFASAFR